MDFSFPSKVFSLPDAPVDITLGPCGGFVVAKDDATLFRVCRKHRRATGHENEQTLSE